MKKKIFVSLALIIAISCVGYYLYYQRQPHYTIKGVEKALKDGMIVPSSFKIKEAIFNADSGEGFVLIKMIYKNKFGADTDSYIILRYAAKKIENITSDRLKKVQYEIFQRKKEDVKNGKINIEPFDTMSFVSASIGENNSERELSKIEFTLISSSINLEKLKYKGPSLGGKVIELRDDGKHKFEFSTVRYIPDGLFPYQKD